MRGTRFAELNAFVAVAEQASFTKAARRLGLSTATLSQTVRALEDHLGVRLLNRTTRSVAPTDAGERLLAQLRPLLDGFEAAIESVNAFRETPTGRLRLTMPPPVARFVLAPVLARFLKRYPEIVLETTVESGLTDIVADRFDAGFRRGNLVARDMIAVRVTNDLHYRVVGSPDYVARYGRPRTPADLHAHNCIRYRLPGGGFIPWLFVEDGKLIEFDIAGSLIVINDPELVINAALQGVGIAYLCRADDRGRTAGQSFGQIGVAGDGRLLSVLSEPAAEFSGAAGVDRFSPRRVAPKRRRRKAPIDYNGLAALITLRVRRTAASRSFELLV